MRLCHVIIAIGLLTLLISLTIALWWSLTKNDVSGGFTMAAYVVAIAGLPLRRFKFGIIGDVSAGGTGEKGEQVSRIVIELKY